MSKLARFFVATVSLSLATACAQKTTDEPRNRRRERRTPVYIAGSFPFAPYDGPSAKFANLGQTEITTSYFGKRFDKKDLEAVVDASAFSSVDYARQMGIELYRVPRPDDFLDAVYFVNLAEPPEEFDYLWDWTPNGDKRTILAGLYFDACPHRGNCEAGRVVRPTILLDESTDRWTLVHEMMHHFFQAQRKADGENDYRVIDEARATTELEVQRRQGEYRAQPSRATAEALVVSYGVFSTLVRRRLIAKELEEFADEAHLLEEWRAKRFTYVFNRSAKNAYRYMHAQREKALELLAPLREQTLAWESEFNGRGWTAEASRFRALSSSINELITSTEVLLDRADASTRDLPSDGHVHLAGARVERVEAPISRCTHANEGHDAWAAGIRSLGPR